MVVSARAARRSSTTRITAPAVVLSGRLRRRRLRHRAGCVPGLDSACRPPRRSARASAGGSILRPGCCGRTATSPRFASPRSRGQARWCFARRPNPESAAPRRRRSRREAGRGRRFATGVAAASSSASAPTTPIRRSRRRRWPTRAGGRLRAAACASTGRRGRSRWQEADVVVEGDPELQKAIRFALFHLMASVGDDGRGGGRGARAQRDGLQRPRLLGQRRLRAALPRRHAPSGRPGDARVPRASPARRTRGGAAARPGRRPLRLGVRRRRQRRDAGTRRGSPPASSSASGRASSRSTSSATSPGRPPATSPGRATTHSPPGPDATSSSRLRATGPRASAYDRDGSAHIYGVIGPDEYHEPVDDNAFTNVLARWNLRQAAALDGVDEDERARWLAIADALVDGYDARERHLRAVRWLLRARAARSSKRSRRGGRSPPTSCWAPSVPPGPRC